MPRHCAHKESAFRHFHKQLKPRLVRPKMAGGLGEIVGTVIRLREAVAAYVRSPTIAKILACRDTPYQNREQ